LKLLDNKEIRSISDDSKEDQWNILLEAPQAFCSMDHDKLVAKLGLTLSLTETLNCWGWDGKIHMFDTVQELLGYWIEGRLVYLEKRRLSKIERLAADATWLDVKRRFISMWNADSQTLVTLKKDGLYRAIKLALSVDDETVARLLSSNIMSLTSTQVEELDKQIKEINAKIDSLKTTTPQAMMLTDIDSVK
jgi:DNA gyrase/topoisomerase IV subunit A